MVTYFDVDISEIEDNLEEVSNSLACVLDGICDTETVDLGELKEKIEIVLNILNERNP